MSSQLEGLKQELFSYWTRHPRVGYRELRAVGFEKHLDTLYEGDSRRAFNDFYFYRFVKTAQRYLKVKSTTNKERLEERLSLHYAEFRTEFPGLIAVQLVLLAEPDLLKRLLSYIIENPPGYDENYRLALQRAFETPEETASRLLEESGLPMTNDAEILFREDREGAYSSIVAERLVQASGLRVISREEDLQRMKEAIGKMLSTLNKREQQVLMLRYGLDGKERTLKEIGEAIGRSSSTVRRITISALRKLRQQSDRRRLQEFFE